MGKVVVFGAVSLDGYVADENDQVGPLFDHYGNGDVPVAFGDGEPVVRTTAATAEFLQSVTPSMAVVIVGRRTFDLTDGFDGVPPAGEHVVVVTHQEPTDWAYRDTAPFTFVTDGVRSAVERARALAGDRDVEIAAGDIAGQALREGLVDRVVLSLVPAVLGAGRPYFGEGGLTEAIQFDDPQIVAGSRVTHLVYDVRR